MSEFRGARGSNTGDDFHELWATRHAIRLLAHEDYLEALAVEGLEASDEAGEPDETWDGVDCTQYLGGTNAGNADRVVLEQLKYSASRPESPWSVARFISGQRRKSVVNRLAKSWKGLCGKRSGKSCPEVAFVTNQPISNGLKTAFSLAASKPLKALPKRKPSETSSDVRKLAYATGLTTVDEFTNFAKSVSFNGSEGSRFAVEERALSEVAKWLDQDIQGEFVRFRQFVRNYMLPERSGELIHRETVLLHFGVSDPRAIFPCSPDVVFVENPVPRECAGEVLRRMNRADQFLCLHGGSGVGKTTVLREIEQGLPIGSLMVLYDCYGGGRYLDSSELRHRPADAFVQMTNEIAAKLKLPLLLVRHPTSDYPRTFLQRLERAAKVLEVQHPDALLVVAVDAADNSITAAKKQIPTDRPFVLDFLSFEELPANVRFVVTARTGRLGGLSLPSRYARISVGPFSPSETQLNVRRYWDAPADWIEDFHDLSGGIPRVQSYAFKDNATSPEEALGSLRPEGKSLDQVFRQQFEEALRKNGARDDLEKLCAGLITLPRPVPVEDLSAVLDIGEDQISDICSDMRPGIRLETGHIGFADEDFEQFVREEGATRLDTIRKAAADWLLARSGEDAYAALNVASALIDAEMGRELLDLVEKEASPGVIKDPVLRRETEVQRLRLAIKVCRTARDVPRALRFVLIGAEGLKTEAELRKLLIENPDLAAAFAQETAGRLILMDSGQVEAQGALLFHKLSVDAENGDKVSVREGRRLIDAWLQARRDALTDQDEYNHHHAWPITISEIISAVRARLLLGEHDKALEVLAATRQRNAAIQIGLHLPQEFIAAGRIEPILALAKNERLGPVSKLFLQVPLALAGQKIDVTEFVVGLNELVRRRLNLKRFFHGHQERSAGHGVILDLVMTSCEILTGFKAGDEVVDGVLTRFLETDFRRIDERHSFESEKLDLLLRAFVLESARSDRTPDIKEFFLPRPEPKDEDANDYVGRDTYSHDQGLKDLVQPVFEAYASTASYLCKTLSASSALHAFHRASASLRNESWRMDRLDGGRKLRQLAATNMLVLQSTDIDAEALATAATSVHGFWGIAGNSPHEAFVARLSLRQEVHELILRDLSSFAEATRAMRIGANEKVEALVGLSRLLKPVSPDDARVVFLHAVDAASDLDWEIRDQIILLEQLIGIGVKAFSSGRDTAIRFSNVVADAAIRLDGYDGFPWQEVMTSLVRLDSSQALANAARWDDGNLIDLRETLAPLLSEAVNSKSISPASAVALNALVDGDSDVYADAISEAAVSAPTTLPQLMEEAAYDTVARRSRSGFRQVLSEIEKHPPIGHWSTELRRTADYIANSRPIATPEDTQNYDKSEPSSSCLDGYQWTTEVLANKELLRGAVDSLQTQARIERCYLSADEILRSAIGAVELRNRLAFLTVLSELEDGISTNRIVEALNFAIDAWSTPAVLEWCRNELPTVVLRRFPEFARYMPHGQDDLSPALDRMGLTEAERVDFVLQGIERHVDEFGPNQIFAIVSLIAKDLSETDAAELTVWYVSRLESRIVPEDLDQPGLPSALPDEIDKAIARFIFAYLGDFDLRMRWRAAHAVRRLARADESEPLAALIGEYSRQSETVFRDGQFPFFWLAARLWFALAWDRIASESPDVAAAAYPALLEIALDDSFPHLLVRGFARDACEKLLANEAALVADEHKAQLDRVNQSPLPRAQRNQAHWDAYAVRDEGRRFRFDQMDTLPYWYKGIRRGFASLSGERFLDEVERWVIDEWGYSGDVRDFSKERRRARFEREDWSLSSNRHGSIPTLERLSTHLEWHGMWVAAGSLLATEPLVAGNEYDWGSLNYRIVENMLTEPPLWSSDLCMAVPLVKENWESLSVPIEDWAIAVIESDHRREVFPSDRPDYMVVDSYMTRRSGEWSETTWIASALVDPGTGQSLLRALQTMNDPWDYKLPVEGEEHEIQHPFGFNLSGWLWNPQKDLAIDETDPFRGSAGMLRSVPASRVTSICNLTRARSGVPEWFAGSESTPMFVYEEWGDDRSNEYRYTTGVIASGWRLLAHRKQVQDFLQNQEMDLIIESEIERRGRENRRYAGSKEGETPNGRFDRLYSLRGSGELDTAEGCIGSWEGDSPGA